MKFNKPKFWDDKNSIISILLFPVSLITLFIIFLRKKIIKTIKFDIPIICVGNIYVGGTGKTPTAIFLANELLRLGKNPVILRKFYQSHSDEHAFIKNQFENLILCKNRIEGIRKAKQFNYDTVILDDGFQDCRIKKSINILCFNERQLVGNGRLIPSGPLRDNLNSLKEADVILINGSKNENFEKKILEINKNLKIFYSSYEPKNIDDFKNKKLLAIAGIGNPSNFFELLEKHNLNIEDRLIFPDHYQFNQIEINKIIEQSEKKQCQIVMTEKDYFKVKHFNIQKSGYLEVSLKINDKKDFINILNSIYE
jgi:tetraacyldisaccharide 4'-kinase